MQPSLLPSRKIKEAPTTRLDELCLEGYENSQIYKQKLIAGKLRTRWDIPLVITNVFPYGVVELKDENKNNTFQPLGVLEDVLVQVNKLIFPTDFYVLDMEDETPWKGSILILGQPCLKTFRTKIDVHAMTLSMEFGDNLVQFNIFEAMKHPTEDPTLFRIDVIDELDVDLLGAEDPTYIHTDSPGTKLGILISLSLVVSTCIK
ncbi:hypothetical protein CR513_46092, partial [Mucuna pruriens]